MKILHDRGEDGPRVVALGTFDGVHRGHRELLRTGKELARETGALLRVCTFERHPMEILAPGRTPPALQTPEEKMERMARYEADEMRILPFTRETAETEPEEFLRQLRNECRLKAVAVGWNYTFGRKGRGNAELLRADGEKHGYRVAVVPSVCTDAGEVISSTAIRDRLIRGDLEGANEMLGYPYEIGGRMTEAAGEEKPVPAQRMRIAPDPGKQLPAPGVYACRLENGPKAWDGRIRIGGTAEAEAWTEETEPPFFGGRIRICLTGTVRD